MSDDFVNAMRQEVLEKVSPGSIKRENPLRTIGLSEQILEIGLTDDQLYDYCRYQARYLTAQFHRDRPEMRNDETAKKQHRFEEAFNLIKSDRSAFDLALGEFRTLRSSERSSVNFLKRTFESTRLQLRGYQDRELDIGRAESDAEAKLQAAREALSAAEVIKELEQGRVSDLEKDISRLTGMLTRNENAAIKYRKRYDNCYDLLTSLSQQESEGVHIFDVKWVLVATPVWNSWFNTSKKDRIAKHWEKPHGLDLADEEVERVKAQWKHLKSIRPHEKSSGMRLHNGIIRISSCRVSDVVGLPVLPDNSCILGSISRTPDEVRRLARPIERDEILERIHPWVVPGHTLVLQKFWRMSENSRIENQKDPKPLYLWDTNHIVLAVGK